MRAVNLIPADARSGGGAGTAGRSGGAVYALLGGLALLVAMAGLWATTSGKVADDRAELARVQQQVAAAQARANELQSPGDVQQTRLVRTETVRALATQRHNWAATLDHLSRTLPADTTLTGLNATSAGASGATPGAAPVATATGGADAGPTVVLNGCAPSQRAVARLMPRLRTVPDVTDVQLVSSNLAADGADADAGVAAESACRGATFVMNLGLEAVAAPVTGVAPGTATAAAPGTVPASTATTAVPGTPTAAGGTK